MERDLKGKPKLFFSGILEVSRLAQYLSRNIASLEEGDYNLESYHALVAALQNIINIITKNRKNKLSTIDTRKLQVFDSASMICIVCTVVVLDLKVVYLNKIAEETFGKSQLGKSFQDLLNNPQKPIFDALEQIINRKKSVIEFNTIFKTQGGSCHLKAFVYWLDNTFVVFNLQR